MQCVHYLSYFCCMENVNLDERIRSLSDDDLVELLKMRDHYQSEAVAIAIEDALNRGIIFSEQDLEMPKFQPDQSHSRSLFPHLNKEHQFQKVFTSLIRVLYLIAILPMLFGVLKLVEYELPFGISLLVLGLAWVFLCIWLQKNKNSQIPWMLAGIFSIGVGVVFYNQTIVSTLNLTDHFVIGLAVILVFYILTYLQVLTNRRKDKKNISD